MFIAVCFNSECGNLVRSHRFTKNVASLALINILDVKMVKINNLNW